MNLNQQNYLTYVSHWPLSHNTQQTFPKIFRTNLNITTLLEVMYKDRVMANSMDLLPYITWTDVEPSHDDPVEDLGEYFERQLRFLELLRHYLRGKGHPQGAVGVSQEAFQVSRDDAALCPTLFLEAVTSLRFLPLTHLRITVTTSFPERPSELTCTSDTIQMSSWSWNGASFRSPLSHLLQDSRVSSRRYFCNTGTNVKPHNASSCICGI